MYFSTIIGYHAIKKKLCDTIQSGKTPQAQLIIGPQSSPVLPLSIALATYLQCTQKTTQDACTTCPSCKKSSKYLHPDIYFTFPIGALPKQSKTSPTIAAMPAWRTFLTTDPYESFQTWTHHLGSQTKNLQINTLQIEETTTFLRTHPLQSRYKIVIIWLPEYMSTIAANKILKVLEEPPPRSFILLAAHQRSNILPTIYSRTWTITIPPWQDQHLIQALTLKHPHLSTQQKNKITTQSSGNLWQAYRLANEQDTTHFKSLSQWLRSLYAHHWDKMLETAEQFAKQTPSEQKAWITYALQLMRNTLILQQNNQAHSIMGTPIETDFCKKLGQTINITQLQSFVTKLEEMHTKLTRNAHPKLLFIATSLTISDKFSAPPSP